MTTARFYALCALVVSAPKLPLNATLILGSLFTGFWLAHALFPRKTPTQRPTDDE